MAVNLLPILEAMTSEAILEIFKELPTVITYIRKYELLSMEEMRQILSMAGTMEEKAKKVWQIVSKAVTKDWIHFWKFIMVLIKSKLPDLLEKLIPSHFREGWDTQVIDKAQYDKLQLDDGGIESISTKDAHHWLTGDVEVRDLVKSLVSTPDEDAKLRLVKKYVQKLDSLKSIHPADEDVVPYPFVPEVDANPSKPTKPVKPKPSKPVTPDKPDKPVNPVTPEKPIKPDQPDKSKKSQHILIIIVILIIVAITLTALFVIGFAI